MNNCLNCLNATYCSLCENYTFLKSDYSACVTDCLIKDIGKYFL